MLNHARVDLLLDVGANVGQYAMRRIETGYSGRIVSFEPLSGPRAALEKEAAGHPNWSIAEPRRQGGQHHDSNIRKFRGKFPLIGNRRALAVFPVCRSCCK
jgi:hypothetical protein